MKRWTPEEVTEFKELWLESTLPGWKIGIQLSKSASSIYGKAHRLKLRRPSLRLRSRSGHLCRKLSDFTAEQAEASA
jgi:hypothetical protein